jgi:hypothetical protein
MVRKFIFSGLVLLGLAPMIPAPIPSVSERRPAVKERTQAELTATQSLNGSVKEVGKVPNKLSETGMVLEDARVRSSQSGASALTGASERADTVGGKVITKSEERLAEEKRSGFTFGTLVALIVSASGYMAFRAFRKYMDKVTPVPKLSKSLLRNYK